jgi:hypothetical protein
MIDKRTTKVCRRAIGAVVIAAALGATFFPVSAASARDKDCGKVTAVRYQVASQFRVTVGRGSVSCEEARSVIKDYNSGKGTLHKPRPWRGSWYTTLPGGWSCASGAGGEETCARGPKVSRYEHRDEVYAASI